MGDYRQRVTLRVLGQDLDDMILSVSETDDTPTKTVKTMNKRKEARGYKQGNSDYALELDAEPLVDPTLPNLPDWHQLKADRTRFTIAITPDVGIPVQYGQCIVTRVVDNTSDGDGSVKVSVLALTRKAG